MGGLVVVEQQKKRLAEPPRSHADTAESEELAIIAAPEPMPSKARY
jgi:hypothetical protein